MRCHVHDVWIPTFRLSFLQLLHATPTLFNDAELPAEVALERDEAAPASASRGRRGLPKEDTE